LIFLGNKSIADEAQKYRIQKTGSFLLQKRFFLFTLVRLIQVGKVRIFTIVWIRTLTCSVALKNIHLKDLIIVMGVSGSGKSTIAKKLAQKLNITYQDADDFHPPANVEGMASGAVLNDTDRQPWLENLADLLAKNKDQGLVLACSALKESYRQTLNAKLKVPATTVFLSGTYELIYQRMQNRKDHFMPPALLQSQFRTLEEPDHAIKVSIDQSIEAIVAEILDHLG